MNEIILLVEDDIEFGQTLKDYFEDNGLSIIWAQNGTQGISLFKKEKPNLILLDVQLPDINGFEVATQIQKINNNIPLIFITGTALREEDFTNAYLNLYAKNYLEKPIRLPVALAQVKSILYPPSTKVYTIRDVQITIVGQHVTINNQEFNFKEKEVQVFTVLLDNIERTIDRKIFYLKYGRAINIT